jgi:hypothetical protein
MQASKLMISHNSLKDWTLAHMPTPLLQTWSPLPFPCTNNHSYIYTHTWTAGVVLPPTPAPCAQLPSSLRRFPSLRGIRAALRAAACVLSSAVDEKHWACCMSVKIERRKYVHGSTWRLSPCGSIPQQLALGFNLKKKSVKALGGVAAMLPCFSSQRVACKPRGFFL